MRTGHCVREGERQTTVGEVEKLMGPLEAGSGCGPERLQCLIRSIRSGKALPGVAQELARRQAACGETGQYGSKTG